MSEKLTAFLPVTYYFDGHEGPPKDRVYRVDFSVSPPRVQVDGKVRNKRKWPNLDAGMDLENLQAFIFESPALWREIFDAYCERHNVRPVPVPKLPPEEPKENPVNHAPTGGDVHLSFTVQGGKDRVASR